MEKGIIEIHRDGPFTFLRLDNQVIANIPASKFIMMDGLILNVAVNEDVSSPEVSPRKGARSRQAEHREAEVRDKYVSLFSKLANRAHLNLI